MPRTRYHHVPTSLHAERQHDRGCGRRLVPGRLPRVELPRHCDLVRRSRRSRAPTRRAAGRGRPQPCRRPRSRAVGASPETNGVPDVGDDRLRDLPEAHRCHRRSHLVLRDGGVLVLDGRAGRSESVATGVRVRDDGHDGPVVPAARPAGVPEIDACDPAGGRAGRAGRARRARRAAAAGTRRRSTSPDAPAGPRSRDGAPVASNAFPSLPSVIEVGRRRPRWPAPSCPAGSANVPPTVRGAKAGEPTIEPAKISFTQSLSVKM